METSSFQRRAEAILDEVLSWEPTYATQVGWHKYDDLLPDWSKRSLQRQLDRMDETSKELKRVDEGSLSADELIDRDLAMHFMKLRTFELTELRMHEKASMATREIGDALFFLFARDRPSVEQRFQAIAARLEKVPVLLKQSQAILKTPYRLWNEVQIETGERIPQFLREIETVCEAKSNDKDTTRRVESAVKEATAAIEEHNRWLVKDVIPNSSKEYSVGPDLYGRYLLMKGFGVNADETLHIAELYLEDVNKKKTEVSRKIVSSGRSQEALRKMRCDHAATCEGVLKEYRSSVLEAKEFVEEKKLATIPEGERLHVLETPYFMRHLMAYAAQFEPGKFDDDMNGIFLVTPDDGNPALLEEHSHATIVNTSVHEGYPGHHLHGVCMNIHPSFIRPLCQSPDFAEGWALYCEDMMQSQGYNNTPMGQLAILNDLAFRIARQICDVRLSTNAMSLEHAADFIAAQTETNLKAATSEAKAIMLNPTYSTAYFVGKLGVLQIREDVQNLMGSRFDLKFFHDSLIYSGCMPMSFMRRAVAVNIKEKYGMDLGEPTETLNEYAVRNLGGEAA